MNNIIHVDFQKPHKRWLDQAKAAREAGDVCKALEMYRQALADCATDWDAGLGYALLLWENECWGASLRETYRLLCLYPKEEKLYGLLYRNLLAMGHEEAACEAYEHYLWHLYRNPEDGLNLGEDDPPIPPKPPRKRYRRLLLRAAKRLEEGNPDGAERLVARAFRGGFPRQDALRDVLEVQLMAQLGLEDEAGDILEGMLENRELNATLALSIAPLMDRLRGHQYAGSILLYAASVAQSPEDVTEVMETALRQGQPQLALSVAQSLLEASPYRLDVLFNKAIVCIYADDLQQALECMELCNQLDPCDSDVSFLYRTLSEVVPEGAAPEDVQQLPLGFYGSGTSFGRTLALLDVDTLLTSGAEELPAEMARWERMSCLMDCLCRCPDEVIEDLLKTAMRMEAPAGQALVRTCLLLGDLTPELETMAMDLLRADGAEGPVPVMRRGKLIFCPLEDEE